MKKTKKTAAKTTVNKKSKKNGLGKLIPVLMAGIMSLSAVKMADNLVQISAHQEKYASLQETSVSVVDAPTPDFPEDEEILQESIVPVLTNGDDIGYHVDFTDMPTEVQGWFYCPALNLSYPLVKGEDNEFFLTHDYKGDKDANGSVFLDCNTTIDDVYSIIYAHNMGGGEAMFTKLPKITKDTVFHIIREGKSTITLEPFAARYTTTEDSCFMVGYKHTDNLQALIDGSIASSVIDFDAEVSKDDNVVTLSTCVGTPRDARFVVNCVY